MYKGRRLMAPTTIRTLKKMKKIIDAFEGTCKDIGMDKETIKTNTTDQYLLVSSVYHVGFYAKIMPENIKSDHPKVHWNKLAGATNYIVNNYGNLDYTYLWNLKEDEFPKLIEVCNELLDD